MHEVQATPKTEVASERQASAACDPPPSLQVINLGLQRKHRRRAHRACLSCRARKIRCDVIERTPCGNCKWAHIDCVVVGRRRGRYYKFDIPSCKPPDANTRGKVDVYLDSAQPSGALTSLPTPTTVYDPRVRVSNTQCELISKNTTQRFTKTKLRTDLTSGCQKAPQFAQLPGFIKPLTTGIDISDWDYLNSKGALTLPSAGTQTALIWSFFEYVFPFMPIVDLEQFLQSVSNPDGSAGQISLLLLQAVFFAGSSYVELHIIQDAGFQTRKQARKAFFERLRVLYDLDMEPDRFTMIQALLLMALWYNSSHEHRNTWHWIDVAISQCFAAGLHQDPSLNTTPYPMRLQKLRRRVWWTCYMRDRLVSLGMKRLPRVREHDYNVLMLEDSDFEAIPIHKLNIRQDICSYLAQPEKRKVLAKLCIAKAHLCRSLRCSIQPPCTIFAENIDESQSSNPGVLNLDGTDGFTSYNEDLLMWHRHLPECCKYRPLVLDTETSTDATVVLSRAILHMTYYSVLIGLHWSRFTSLSQSPTKMLLFEQEVSKIFMQNAAAQISNVAGDIYEQKLDRFLPALGVSLMASATTIHLLEINEIVPSDSNLSRQGYFRCMSVIDSLTDIYEVAGLAKDALERGLSRPLELTHSTETGTSRASNQDLPHSTCMVGSEPHTRFPGSTPSSESAWSGQSSDKTYHDLEPSSGLYHEFLATYWPAFSVGDLENLENYVGLSDTEQRN